MFLEEPWKEFLKKSLKQFCERAAGDIRRNFGRISETIMERISGEISENVIGGILEGAPRGIAEKVPIMDGISRAI